MKRVLLILCALLVSTSYSQDISGPQSPTKIEENQPSVYLKYVCQNKATIYLRMYNNTIWPLSIKTNEVYPTTKNTIKLSNGLTTHGAPDDKEISLQYRVDRFALPWEKVEVPKTVVPDNGFNQWIASGDSVLFGAPIGHLKENLQIFVRFNYEWEMPKRGAFDTSPEHRVSFRGIDLPDRPQPCKGK